MDLDTTIVAKAEQVLENASSETDNCHSLVMDLVIFGEYGQQVLSQFGFGLCGFQVRQSNGQQLLTVKVNEGGTPLVAFVTAQTTTSCISRFLDLLEHERVNWTRDKYPWS